MAEYLDVVNENNEVIGQEKRSIVHQSGLWHRGVHIFLFTPERKLLVQRRGGATDTFSGALDCSVSEHLKVGESYPDGAQRGLREELGIKGVQLHRRLQFRMPYGENDNMVSELYEGEHSGESLAVDHDEIEEVEYHTIPELEAMMKSGEVTFSSWFRELLHWYTGKPARFHILGR